MNRQINFPSNKVLKKSQYTILIITVLLNRLQKSLRSQNNDRFEKRKKKRTKL